MSQFNSCGYNDYLVALDSMLSKRSQLVGAFSNAITQYVSGMDEKNTSVWIAKDNMSVAWDNDDYEGIGKSFQLFMSQLLKVEAPSVKQAIDFIS